MDVVYDGDDITALRGELSVPGSRDWPGQRPAPDQPDAPTQLRSASPRLDAAPGPERSDATRPADRLAADNQHERWSRDDLRQRLERLPPGHPSSPRTDATDRNEPAGTPESDAVKRDLWSEEPRFSQAWEDHEHRWPAERVAAAVDRSRDPAGSWRGDGQQYLNPEQHTQSKNVIAMVQRREEGLTPYMGQNERENTCGGRLEGLEHRVKDDDRIKEKIAEMLKRMPDRTVGEVVQALPDIIRYTFCFRSDNYTAGYWDIKGRMEDQGYSMIYSKNHWHDDPQYKGINTRWVTAEGQRFEVQFHTEESFYAKQHITHKSYERLRSPLTQDDERQELRSFQGEVCSWIPVPERATAIPNYYRKVDS